MSLKSILNGMIRSRVPRRKRLQNRPRRDSRLALEPLEDRCLLSSDVVIEWNQTLLNEIRSHKTAPPPASRIMAIVQVAVFDAVNAIDGSYSPYLLQEVPKKDKNSSLVAAAAQAAHDTLVAFYPQDQSALDAQLQGDLAAVRDKGALKKGVEVGQLAAAAILQARAHDGADTTVPYTPGTDPGTWQPTPPGFLPSAFPQWPTLTPFTMTTGAQFRPDGPPALDSVDYATAYNEVKAYGGNGTTTPTIRTPEQTLIANFWADGSGTETPPGHWNSIAQDLAQTQGTTLVQNARLFAVLDLAMADAAIAAWDTKYAFNFWRPVTAIRYDATVVNPDCVPDPNWTPLLVTPNFPSYTSGHSTFSSAGATVLADFFGTDHITFTIGSDFLPGVTRTFSSLSAAAAEAGQSRIYGGIHYQFDNQDALHAGHDLADYVSQHYLLPVGPSASFQAATMPAALPTGAANAAALAIINGAGTFFIPALGITSHFGMGVHLNTDGSATGHFECHTPGVDDLVGTVTAGHRNTDGSVTFGGTATLLLPGQGRMTNLSFEVTLYAGEPGAAHILLSVPDAGIIDCPELLATGHIQMG